MNVRETVNPFYAAIDHLLERGLTLLLSASPAVSADYDNSVSGESEAPRIAAFMPNGEGQEFGTIRMGSWIRPTRQPHIRSPPKARHETEIRVI